MLLYGILKIANMEKSKNVMTCVGTALSSYSEALEAASVTLLGCGWIVSFLTGLIL